MSSTTKRFVANTNCQLDCFDITEQDLYQFGCEFEFYIDKKHDFKNIVSNIKDEIYKFSNVDILVDLVLLPTDSDKNNCIQIKPDNSLKENGVEISIPISSRDGVAHYIKNILPIIEKYGYTNEDTGLHFHISTLKKDGVNFDFYVYMLMCYDKNLLSSWKTRGGYSHNVMDILSGNPKSKTRKIKTKKGTIWNLERVASNHIEIKSMGGVDYHRQIEKILSEFHLYADCFDMVHTNREQEYRLKLVCEHKLLIEKTLPKQKEEFIKAINESNRDSFIS